MFTVRLLGSVEIRDAAGSESDALPRQPKRLGLLSYLATAQPRGFHRRDKLVALFWPEASQEQARHSLSQALHVLRSELGQAAVRGRGDSDVAIDEASISCDVVEFEQAVEAGEYEEALDLYRGDLLEGLFVREASEFERWLEDERTRLREKASGAAWALAHEHIAADHLVDAERIAQRALLLVATDESEVRRFIQALADAGDRAAAVRFYERFTQRLRAEYEIEPDPVTVECAERIRNKKSAADRGSAAQESTEAGHRAQAMPSGGATPTGTIPLDHVAKRRWMMAGAAVAAAVVIAAIAVIAAVPRGGSVALDPDRIAVAVLDNQTGDPSLDQLGSMTANWITQGLLNTGILEVLPSVEALQAWRYVAGEIDAGRVTNLVRAFAEETGAGTVVSGAIYRQGDTLRVQMEVTDARTHKPLGTIPVVSGRVGAERAVIEAVRERVMGFLAVAFDERLSTQAAVGGTPPTFDAYRAFDEGLGYYVRSMYWEAFPPMHRAFALDSTFILPLLFAASSYIRLIERAQADSVLRLVQSYGDQLSNYHRLWLEILQAKVEGDWERQYRAGRRGAELTSGTMLVFEHARVALRGFSQPQEALDALATLDPERGPMRGRIPYWAVKTEALHDLGDYQGELQAARQARRLYPDRHRAFGFEGMALAALGRGGEVIALVDEALAMRSHDWSLDGPADFMISLGLEARIHGQPEVAQGVFERVIEWYWAQMPEGTCWDGTINLGWALYHNRQFADAKTCWESILPEPDLPDVRRHEIRGALGLVAAKQGDLPEARRVLQWHLDLDLPYLHLPGHHLCAAAAIAEVLGDRQETEALLRQAFWEGFPHQRLWLNWYGLESLGSYEP
jgi:DNA-binding SARP family transcriptional activator